MPDHIIESLLIMAVGLGGVFASLLLLMVLIWLMQTVDERLNARRIRRYAEKIETHRIDESGMNDELVAVLAAAASTMLQPHVVVRRIRFLGPAPDESWSTTGRLGIMESHTVPKKS